MVMLCAAFESAAPAACSHIAQVARILEELMFPAAARRAFAEAVSSPKLRYQTPLGLLIRRPSILQLNAES